MILPAAPVSPPSRKQDRASVCWPYAAENNYTTLENQVTCWVMESAAALAPEYCRANAAFTSDAKVGWVRAFGQRNGTWRTSEWLQGVAHFASSSNWAELPTPI